MNELTVHSDKRMTVREVADVLGVSPDTVYNSAKELFPDIFVSKKTTYLNEAQVTAVKMNFRKNSEVAAQPKTELEMMLQVKQSIEYLTGKITDLQRENMEQKERLTIAEPKAAFTDLAMQSSDVLSMNDAAKILKLGYGNKTLYRKLREQGVLMADNVPYQEYISRGYFRVDESPILIGDYIQIKRVTKVTQKGMMWLSRMIEQQAATA